MPISFKFKNERDQKSCVERLLIIIAKEVIYYTGKRMLDVWLEMKFEMRGLKTLLQ